MYLNTYTKGRYIGIGIILETTNTHYVLPTFHKVINKRCIVLGYLIGA